MAANIFKVEGMNCEQCVKHVEKAINHLDYVDSVDVSLENEQMIIRSDHAFTVEEVQNLMKENDCDYNIKDTTFNH